MDDYTELGVSKIAMQAQRGPREIRCPRDGAVMRVTGCVAEEQDGLAPRRFGGLPGRGSWRLLSVDVECPACRRRGEGVWVAKNPAPPVRTA